MNLGFRINLEGGDLTPAALGQPARAAVILLGNLETAMREHRLCMVKDCISGCGVRLDIACELHHALNEIVKKHVNVNYNLLLPHLLVVI